MTSPGPLVFVIDDDESADYESEVFKSAADFLSREAPETFKSPKALRTSCTRVSSSKGFVRKPKAPASSADWRADGLSSPAESEQLHARAREVDEHVCAL